MARGHRPPSGPRHLGAAGRRQERRRPPCAQGSSSSSAQLHREYLALVEGRPPARTGTVDAPIGRHRRDRTLMSIDTAEPSRGTHALRAGAGVPGRHAAARRARHRPDPPDPRSPGRDRSSGRRRPPVREPRPCTASSASSCTRRGSRSHTRSPPRRSTSARRCPTISKAALELAATNRTEVKYGGAARPKPPRRVNVRTEPPEVGEGRFGPRPRSSPKVGEG